MLDKCFHNKSPCNKALSYAILSATPLLSSEFIFSTRGSFAINFPFGNMRYFLICFSTLQRFTTNLRLSVNLLIDIAPTDLDYSVISSI